jgi:hypothetical protein
MKKLVIITLALTMCLMFGTVSTAYAAYNIDINVAGENPTTVQGFVVNNYTYMPVRSVCENLGADVTCKVGYPYPVRIEKDGNIIRISLANCVGSSDNDVVGWFTPYYAQQLLNDIYYVNGNKVENIPASFSYGDLTYAPARFICEALGFKVDYSPGAVTISAGQTE